MERSERALRAPPASCAPRVHKHNLIYYVEVERRERVRTTATNSHALTSTRFCVLLCWDAMEQCLLGTVPAVPV